MVFNEGGLRYMSVCPLEGWRDWRARGKALFLVQKLCLINCGIPFSLLFCIWMGLVCVCILIFCGINGLHWLRMRREVSAYYWSGTHPQVLFGNWFCEASLSLGKRCYNIWSNSRRIRILTENFLTLKSQQLAIFTVRIVSRTTNYWKGSNEFFFFSKMNNSDFNY